MASNDHLVTVENLRMYFPVTAGLVKKRVGDVKAVDDVSFYIKKGETLGLVGESGCGKTTTGRCILKLYEPSGGKVFFEGREITALNDKEMRKVRRHMQLIFQDPYASLDPRMTCGDIVGEHRVLFLGQGEFIELRHFATSRRCFAAGTLEAVRFIVGKAPGLYTMKDLLTQYFD